jgi:hypothetical protein
MNLINLSVPLETVNAALVALSKFPYDQAQPHIDLIRGQAEPQAQAQAAAEAEAKAQAEAEAEAEQPDTAVGGTD